MRYLAPATNVHDELDLVTIPSLGKAEPAPRKSTARETRSSRKARPAESRGADEVARSAAARQSGAKRQPAAFAGWLAEDS
jgi:hypothetical protein